MDMFLSIECLVVPHNVKTHRQAKTSRQNFRFVGADVSLGEHLTAHVLGFYLIGIHKVDGWRVLPASAQVVDNTADAPGPLAACPAQAYEDNFRQVVVGVK